MLEGGGLWRGMLDEWFEESVACSLLSKVTKGNVLCRFAGGGDMFFAGFWER